MYSLYLSLYLLFILKNIKIGDHLQTFQTQSEDLQVHDWGDIEIKDNVVLQKTQVRDNHLPPPHTLIMDFTMTHVRFGHSHLNPIGQFTYRKRSDGPPDPNGALKEAVRIKIRHYRNLYLN